jgi:hypothetical protein
MSTSAVDSAFRQPSHFPGSFIWEFCEIGHLHFPLAAAPVYKFAQGRFG